MRRISPIKEIQPFQYLSIHKSVDFSSSNPDDIPSNRILRILRRTKQKSCYITLMHHLASDLRV